MKFRSFIWLVAVMAIVLQRPLSGVEADAVHGFDGAKTSWHGFDRYDFLMDEDSLNIQPADTKAPGGVKGQRRCIVVSPKVSASGNPWSWRGCYWDHEPQTEIELLKRGFHIAYITADASLKPDNTWAIENSDKVSCIYAENAVLRSKMSKTPPLDNLAPLAKARVPILHLCGSLDPWFNDHTRVAEKRYKELGGQMTVIVKEGEGHYPLAPKNPKLIVDFIIEYSLIRNLCKT